MDEIVVILLLCVASFFAGYVHASRQWRAEIERLNDG